MARQSHVEIAPYACLDGPPLSTFFDECEGALSGMFTSKSRNISVCQQASAVPLEVAKVGFDQPITHGQAHRADLLILIGK